MYKKDWGQHVAYNCKGADINLMTSYDNVYNFAKELVVKIDMVAYGEPQIVNFGTGDKAGFTLVQLIETSNISAHFANERREIYLDVFSCKDFNANTVVNLLFKYFNVKNVVSRFVDRSIS